jgi:hypothetical protein
MIAELTFNRDEDEAEFRMACDGKDMYFILCDINRDVFNFYDGGTRFKSREHLLDRIQQRMTEFDFERYE